MAEFRIGDHQYRTRGKMNARAQFHVARRLAPLVSQLATLGPLLQAATEGGDGLAVELFARPLTDALVKMTDTDCDYVLDHCLGLVQRLQGGNGSGQQVWSDIWNARASRMQFEDIELPEMLQIAVEVLQESIGGFFATSPVAAMATRAATADSPASTGLQ
jgi:hypothetical protein